MRSPRRPLLPLRAVKARRAAPRRWGVRAPSLARASAPPRRRTMSRMPTAPALRVLLSVLPYVEIEACIGPPEPLTGSIGRSAEAWGSLARNLALRGGSASWPKPAHTCFRHRCWCVTSSVERCHACKRGYSGPARRLRHRPRRRRPRRRPTLQVRRHCHRRHPRRHCRHPRHPRRHRPHRHHRRLCRH